MGQLIDYFQHTLWYQKAERNRFEFRVRKDLSGGVICLPLLEKITWRFQAQHLLGQDRNSILKMSLKFK